MSEAQMSTIVFPQYRILFNNKFTRYVSVIGSNCQLVLFVLIVLAKEHIGSLFQS